MDKAILDKYRERWIALNGEGVVLADAAELDTLLHTLDNSGVVAMTVLRIPAANEPLFVGLR